MSGTSGTIHTDDFILTEQQQDGQGEGSFTLQQVRDLTVSKVNVLDLFDDAVNASGLSAPAIINGTIYAHKAAGLTVGTGLSTGVRAANATALQGIINYAMANSKYLEVIPNTYEIYSSTGLTVALNAGSAFNFTWRGSSSGSVISQFFVGAPVLTIGSTSTAPIGSGVDVQGVSLQYGISQATQIASTALLLGSFSGSRVGGITVAAAGFAPYNGIGIITANGGRNYANSYDDWQINQAQNDLLRFDSIGSSGSNFTNICMTSGGATLSGFAINFVQGSLDLLFSQLNINNTVANRFFNCHENYGLRFDSLHLDGNSFNGLNPGWFTVGGDMTVTIDTMNILNCIVLAGNISGTPSFMQAFVDSQVHFEIRNLGWFFWTVGLMNTKIIGIIGAAGGIPRIGQWNISIDGGVIKDYSGGTNVPGNFQFDQHTPLSTSAFLTPASFTSYRYGTGGSKIHQAQFTVSATYTHYGQYTEAMILVPASVTGFTITLAATMGLTGNLPPDTGTTVCVFRMAGSASGTVLVKDSGGATLYTNTVSSTYMWARYNGTIWVVFTPVT